MKKYAVSWATAKLFSSEISLRARVVWIPNIFSRAAVVTWHLYTTQEPNCHLFFVHSNIVLGIVISLWLWAEALLFTQTLTHACYLPFMCGSIQTTRHGPLLSECSFASSHFAIADRGVREEKMSPLSIRYSILLIRPAITILLLQKRGKMYLILDFLGDLLNLRDKKREKNYNCEPWRIYLFLSNWNTIGQIVLFTQSKKCNITKKRY